MSTFKGVVIEFPHIRIDYFRKIPDKPPPLACFLSHVHSDHLLGLESLKSPFVYCSPSTKELLLRLEKYPHRMNFAKGILETRKQTYKHLKSLLKTIPLCTPTTIELSPGKEIRVTFFDANHCAGAVMILIEGCGKAILYTGDIRSETWCVEALKRQPLLIPYTMGSSSLDTIYLDTTFATNLDPYRRFPSKAEGLQELLGKVAKYPNDTVFHFNAWTFGYEDVWIALSAALRTPIHLDNYRMRLYNAFAPRSLEHPPCVEGPALSGYRCGNRDQPGCLTANARVRLHSCERGTSCPGLEACDNVVTITPIISRLSNGLELPELGAGGGRGDLDQFHELEISDNIAVAQLMSLCANKIKDRKALAKVVEMLSSAMAAHQSSIRLTVAEGEDAREFKLAEALQGDFPLQDLVDVLIKMAIRNTKGPANRPASGSEFGPGNGETELPQHITFPYSRHSSYEELCLLVGAFKPKDVYPCTVDEKTWNTDVGMRALFGHLCHTSRFAHDEEMRQRLRKSGSPLRKRAQGISDNLSSQLRSQITDDSETESEHEVTTDTTSPVRRSLQANGPADSMQKHKKPNKPGQKLGTASEPIIVLDVDVPSSPPQQGGGARPARSTEVSPAQPQPVKTNAAHPRLETMLDPGYASTDEEESLQAKTAKDDDPAFRRKLRIKRQRLIYQSVLSSDAAASQLGLVSTYDNHTRPEVEL